MHASSWQVHSDRPLEIRGGLSQFGFGINVRQARVDQSTLLIEHVKEAQLAERVGLPHDDQVLVGLVNHALPEDGDRVSRRRKARVRRFDVAGDRSFEVFPVQAGAVARAIAASVLPRFRPRQKSGMDTPTLIRLSLSTIGAGCPEEVTANRPSVVSESWV